jgi:hypothetical protein
VIISADQKTGVKNRRIWRMTGIVVDTSLYLAASGAIHRDMKRPFNSIAVMTNGEVSKAIGFRDTCATRGRKSSANKV